MAGDSLEGDSEFKRESAALRRMMNHPDVQIRMRAKKLWKEIEPTANFPDLDAHEREQQLAQKHEADMAALRREILERDVKAERESKAERARQAGLTLEQVERVMVDDKIADYDTAIRYIKGQSALAPPTPASVTPIRMPDNMKDIQKNPTQWARNAAHEAMNEILAKRAVAS